MAAGYPSPAASEEDAAALHRPATAAVGEDMLAEAEAALTTAAGGPTGSAQMEAQSTVNDAQRKLNLAIATRHASPAPADDLAHLELQNEVALQQEQLDIAIAARERRTPAQAPRASHRSRQRPRGRRAGSGRPRHGAREHHDSTPAAEVVYFSNLPRRVDQVQTKRGTTLSGSTPFMERLRRRRGRRGLARASDAELLEVGMTGTFPVPDGGGTITGTVSEIVAATESEAPEGEDGGEGEGGDSATTSRFTVTFVPEGLTDEQIAVLLGQNIKITVPVSSTGEEVLAVPAAALTVARAASRASSGPPPTVRQRS